MMSINFILDYMMTELSLKKSTSLKHLWLMYWRICTVFNQSYEPSEKQGCWLCTYMRAGLFFLFIHPFVAMDGPITYVCYNRLSLQMMHFPYRGNVCMLLFSYTSPGVLTVLFFQSLACLILTVRKSHAVQLLVRSFEFSDKGTPGLHFVLIDVVSWKLIFPLASQLKLTSDACHLILLCYSTNVSKKNPALVGKPIICLCAKSSYQTSGLCQRAINCHTSHVRTFVAFVDPWLLTVPLLICFWLHVRTGLRCK